MLAALAAGSTVSSRASAQAPNASRQAQEWEHFFPIFGDKLAERGIEFRLFWRVGLNTAYLDQPIAIDDTGGARGVLATTRAVVNSSVAILISNYFLTSWIMGL